MSAPSETFLLGQLHDDRLRLRRPITLDVEQGDGGIYVSHAVLDEWGYGEYLTAAVEDFQRCVAETYWELKSNADRLGPRLAQVWETMQHLVIEAIPA